MPPGEVQKTSPRLTAFLRPAALAVAAIATLVLWISTMVKARGDFLLHLEFGRRLRTGTFLYTNGMHLPYPPFWAMLFAPFSLLPARVAMPLFFVLGFAALVALLAILRELTRPYFPNARTFWVTTVVLVVLSRFVLRDLADGGENLLILALTWGGIRFFLRGKALPGGALLGLAIALKCTPLLFAGYFVLKRQWLNVLSTLAFATVFFLSPALVQGPASYMQHIAFWKQNVTAGVSQKDPSVGVLGPEELHNKALRPMLARYLMQLPDGHPMRFGGRAYIDFLRLRPATAGTIIKCITLLSGLAVFVLFLRSPRSTPVILWECALVNLFMLLFSPITWGEHCVAIIPALYLITLLFDSGAAIAPWIQITTAIVAAALVLLNRSIIGVTFSDLLESYHVITLCMLALVAVSFAFWAAEVRGQKPEVSGAQ